MIVECLVGELLQLLFVDRELRLDSRTDLLYRCSLLAASWYGALHALLPLDESLLLHLLQPLHTLLCILTKRVARVEQTHVATVRQRASKRSKTVVRRVRSNQVARLKLLNRRQSEERRREKGHEQHNSCARCLSVQWFALLTA